MTRQTVRTLKRAVRDGECAGANEASILLSQKSALALLARSVAFDHGRLAVIRLAMAVNSGAQVCQEYWTHCFRVASSAGDVQLEEIYRAAAVKATAGVSRSK